MVTALEKAKAKDKIIESVRDLYSAKITLPLGNPNLKLVHTNQFIFTELPTEVFELANLDAISKALNSTYSRYSGYTLNRWYIEAVTITNDGNTAKMELDLNPFASTVIKFRDEKNSFRQAYTSTMKSTSSSSTSKTNIKSVKGENTTLRGGEGKVIDDLVKDIIGVLKGLHPQLGLQVLVAVKDHPDPAFLLGDRAGPGLVIQFHRPY